MSASKLIPIGCSANPPLSNFNKADSSAKTLQACLAYGKDPKNGNLCHMPSGKSCTNVLFDSKNKLCYLPTNPDQLTRVLQATNCQKSQYKYYHIPGSSDNNMVQDEIVHNNKRLSILNADIDSLNKEKKVVNLYNKSLQNPSMNVEQVMNMERKKKMKEANNKMIDNMNKEKEDLQKKSDFHNTIQDKLLSVMSFEKTMKSNQEGILKHNVNKLNNLEKNINTVSHEIRNNHDVFDVNSQLHTILYWSIIIGIIILIGVLAMYRVHYD
tara:strand:- start:1735 stop:2541 length:807 start_codon:yes stop_codon:yes gene_type:complete